MQKLFRSFPRKSLLELSGYRQQRRYAGFREGRDGCSGQSKSTPSGNNVSQREGWVLLGSEPRLGREEGWKSFSSEIPGAGWEGNTAVSVLVHVVTAFPSDPTLSPWLQTQHFPAVRRVPSTGLFPCCPLMMASALEFPQKAVKWQKKKAGSFQRVQSQRCSRELLCWEHHVCSLPR